MFYLCVAICLFVRFRLPIGLYSIVCQCFFDCHIGFLHRHSYRRNCRCFWLKSLSPISVEIENGIGTFMGALNVKWLLRVSLGSYGDGSSESSRCERCLMEVRKMVFRISVRHLSSHEKASFAPRLGIFRNVGGRRWKDGWFLVIVRSWFSGCYKNNTKTRENRVFAAKDWLEGKNNVVLTIVCWLFSVLVSSMILFSKWLVETKKGCLPVGGKQPCSGLRLVGLMRFPALGGRPHCRPL